MNEMLNKNRKQKYRERTHAEWSLTMSVVEEQELMIQQLGEEYPQFSQWIMSRAKVSVNDHNRRVDRIEFDKALCELDYNSDQAINDFEQLLTGSGLPLIELGFVEKNIGEHISRTTIILHPEAFQLEIEEEVGEQILDERNSITSLLGLYDDVTTLRQGRHSGEGFIGGTDDETARLEKEAIEDQDGPLEVFQQLGLLYWKKKDASDVEIQPSNYVLVTNAYDDSIWIIWRKYFIEPVSCERLLAKEHWPSEFAVFPGMPEEQGEVDTIACARVARNWTELDPSTDTRL